MVFANYLVPDDILLLVIGFHEQKSGVRALTPRLKEMVDRNFEMSYVKPPAGYAYIVDFEVDNNIAKDLYTAKFGDPNICADMAGSVTFLNWLPAMYRSRTSREMQHSLDSGDGCALWKLITKVRDPTKGLSEDDLDTEGTVRTRPRSSSESSNSSVSSKQEKQGHLTISEHGDLHGKEDGSYAYQTRHVVGKLSALDTEMMLQVLDYRRNLHAQPLLVESS
eukprot:TRINITY_DN51805_c0_g1_i1.p1 TRINITY_DN51805_c0_g1~~TRINITY_DN51805_c0_g1_i1.p1  ORF type:complete len:222 (+),score=46.47 TRINITY_DN51805_c0_g1_i1:190-855(+)